VVLALAALFSVACFVFSYSEDVVFFEFNMIESLERRSFAPSALDMMPFGIRTPQPRMQANLMHTFFPVLGVAANVSPRALVYYVAPPFLGLFVLLALTSFVRAVAGRRLDPLFAFAAVILPVTLFFRGQHVYWYEFRLLNNPSLDKDFDGFFLLPMLLLAAWRLLCGGPLRWLALLAVGGVVMAWTHPVGPIYLLLSCGALAAATLHRERLARVGAVLAVAAGSFVLCELAIDPSETQPYVQTVARLDLEHARATGAPLHYWDGHYTQPGWNEASGITYCCGGRPIVNPVHFFGSSLVNSSVALSLPWLVVVAWRRWRAARHRTSRGNPTAALLAAGALGLAVAVSWRFLPPGPLPTLSLLFGGALAGAVVALLVVASAWRDAPAARAPGAADDADFGPGEIRALRLQAAYLALLLGLYAGAAGLLARSMDLAGGLPRLSWLYLGFFPLAYGCAHLFTLARSAFASALNRWPGGGAARMLPALPALLLILHVADQVQALRFRQATFLTRLGVGGSVVDTWWQRRHRRTHQVHDVNAQDGGQGADAPLAAPPWLRDGDRVLISPTLLIYPGKHEIVKRAVFYRELYSEAFAYQHHGQRFLRDWAAYNDFHEGRVTDRLLTWLRHRDVSVIVVGEAFRSERRYRRIIEALRERWPYPIEEVAEHVFRLREPVIEGPSS
jgi:hypothetical protein